jgi:hypothetical protein
VIHSPGFQMALIGMAAIGTAALVVAAAFGAGLYRASRVLESP